MVTKGVEEASGWKIKRLGDDDPFPNSYPLDEIDRNRAVLLFNQIKTELNRLDRPIVLWGISIPEYGIVKGYEGNSYICSTYRHTLGIPETPVHYESLQAPGKMHAFILTEKWLLDKKRIVRNVLSRGLALAKGNYPNFGYITGPEAFSEWAEVLENKPIDELSYHGNSHIAACQYEAKTKLVQFLSRILDNYHGESRKHLQNAQKSYDKVRTHLLKFTQLFPFAFEGKLEDNMRKKGAKLLRNMYLSENSAIESLEYVLDVLN
ncbi:MAG: hypothetical protein ACFFAE_13480, partial [Candidatus Hodarchaeota archaeon]